MSKTYFTIYHTWITLKRAVHLALCAFLVFFHLTCFALLSVYQIFHCFGLVFLREDLDLCASA